MTTNTMVAIQTQTLGSTTYAVTFNSIPATYTDLMLVISSTLSATDGGNLVQVGNGSVDTGTNYSFTQVYGTGSAAGSNRGTSTTSMQLGRTSSTQSTSILQFMNYANTTTYKTALGRGNDGSFTIANVGLWRSTAAINTITITNESGNFLAGSTFTLYGIANADIGAYATGGIITQDSTYYYHAFGSSGTFTPSRALTADILVVAGGGGSAGGGAGGGGAGGVLGFASQSLSSGTGYVCTVGAGGTSGGISTSGGTGGDSQFAALTLVKGGGGGGRRTSGLTGGSGGGGGASGSSGYSGGSNLSQGYNGGAGVTGYHTGGGGGAGGNGADGSATLGGGAGGAGVNTIANFSNLSTALNSAGLGVNGYIAGGGGGGGTDQGGATNGGAGGAGGGGNGSSTNGVAGNNGVASTGSGGGAGWAGTTDAAGGLGGSGLIIVRYAK